MRSKFFVVMCLLAFSSCTNPSTTPSRSNGDTTTVNTPPAASGNNYSAVIFGKYCGHCLGNCTDMFRYDRRADSNTLLADTTDSYLRKGTFQFDWFLTQGQHPIANALVESIPAQLNSVSDTLTRYGCPDCADQCGFYLETIDASQRSRKFQFDTDTAQVPQELRSFVVQLGNAVNRLKQ